MIGDPAIDMVVAQVAVSGLTVRSVSGDLDAILTSSQRAARTRHLDRLLCLTRNTGALRLVLPNGRLHRL